MEDGMDITLTFDEWTLKNEFVGWMVGGCDDEDTYWRDEVNDAFDGGPGSLYIWKGHTFVNCGSDGWLVDGTMMSDPSEFFYDEWM